MTRVLVDTNIVIEKEQRPLQSNLMRELLALCKDGTLTVVVPEVVVSEAANKWAERVEEATSDYRRARATIEAAELLERESFAKPDLGRVRRQEEKRIREVIDRFDGVVAPLPEVPHREVVERALARLQPFDSKGHDGYRDVVIWETLLELGGDGEEIIFVSKDGSAFFENRKKDNLLAKTLRDEVEKSFGDPEAVRLYFSLREAIDAAVALADTEQETALRARAVENRAERDRLNALIEDLEFRDRLREGVTVALNGYELGRDLREFGMTDSDVVSATVEMVESIERYEFTSVFQDEAGNALAALTVEVSLTAELTVDTRDAVLLSQQPQVMMRDLGWGGGVGEGQAEVAARVTLDCEVDAEEKDLVSVPSVSLVEGLTPKEFLSARHIGR